MELSKKNNTVRLSLAFLILLGGLVLIPFVSLPANALGWAEFARIYEPELTVNVSSGAPGSVFRFTGANYPANQFATVFVNGNAIGGVQTNGDGGTVFYLRTSGALPGLYNVTLEVDINASATESLTLTNGGAIVPPPPGEIEPLLSIGNPLYLPVITRD